MFDNITIQKALTDNQKIGKADARFNLSADVDWKNAMTDLLNAAYDVSAICGSSDLRTEDVSVDMSKVYAAIRNLLTYIGDVNGFKLYANECIAIDVVSYASKKTNEKSNRLKDVETDIRTSDRYFKTLTPANSTEEFRKSCMDKLEALRAEKAKLEAEVGHKSNVRTIATYKSFAYEVECRLARAIEQQNQKSRAQLEAEAEERRKARNAAAKARKAAKKAAAK